MAFEDAYGEVESTSVVAGIGDEVGEDYAGVLRQLLPTGPAWELEDDSELQKLLRALAYSLSRVGIRVRNLLEGYDPRTTTELLEDWERVLALPGDNPVPPTTIAGRRSGVHGKLLGNGDPSIPVFEELAAGVGYEAVVVRHPYDPFVAGSTIGSALYNNTNGGWGFVWLVLTASGAADGLLRWLIESLGPSHGQALFGFQPFLVDEPFDDWTGDDPDGWVVSNEIGSGGTLEISEVGPGEAHGGTGLGACNVFSADGTTYVILEQDLAAALTVGQRYALIFDITYRTRGALIAIDALNLQYFEIFDSVGRHYLEFTATETDVGVTFVNDALATDITIDNVRLVGPLALT